MDRQARVMIFLPLPLIGGEVVGRPGVAVVKVIVNKEMRKKVKERCKEAMVGERGKRNVKMRKERNAPLSRCNNKGVNRLVSEEDYIHIFW